MTHVKSVPCHFIEYHYATYNKMCVGMVPQMFCLRIYIIYIDLLLYTHIYRYMQCRPNNIYGSFSFYMCSAPHSSRADISCFTTRVLPNPTLFWWRQSSLQPSQGVSQCTHWKAKKLWFLYNLLSLFSCWLPSEKGMIFAFVGPMIVILLVRYCTINHTYSILDDDNYTNLMLILL